MRKIVVCIGFLLMALILPFSLRSASAAAGPAPADEYFGRHQVSILEIRNRLDAFDAKSDTDILDPDAVVSLDDLQDAILDWQKKYPDDPWLPRSFMRLLHAYKRAGVASDPAATSALAVMRSAYPDAEETATAVAIVYGGGDNALLADSPIATAQPVTVAPPVVLDDEVPWARFRTLRGYMDEADDRMRIAVSGLVIDAQTQSPIAGAVVFVGPNTFASDVSSTPFAVTDYDGTFSVDGVSLGQAFAGDGWYWHPEYIVVRPPRGSRYAPYRGVVDASNRFVDAGTIRLRE